MPERVWRKMAVAAVVMVAGLAGCDSATEPSFSSGTMSFEWAPEAGGTATVWSVSGSCGSLGFVLGSSTCAVGSDETSFVGALGVKTLEDDRFDTATLVHPTGEGSCEVSSESAARCTLVFLPGRPATESEPIPEYFLSTGTILLEIVVRDAEQRLTGTFEGTAMDRSTLELEPIVITGGTVDVELVP